jgi:hypothetical protein
MQKEREMALKMDEERRRIESDFIMREKAMEDRTRELLR